MAYAGAKEHLVVFHQSIQSIFDGWTGLQLAVRQGYGGPHGLEKARWMVDAVHDWFLENDGIEPYELEDFLADILDHEFDTIVEDDSLNLVATNICTNFHLCTTGHHEAVLEKIKQTPAARIGECVADATEDMEEDDVPDGSVQDANMQAMLGGMRLGQQSHGSSSQNNSEMAGPSSSSSSSLGATGGASSSSSSINSRQEPAEDEDGWTTVRKTKKK
ncbi:pre-rRNA-processing protein TSR2 homolog [Strongylocentrotus purpuratus]|uniref:Pre-rRNA-processing protein TSR2 homolog n=1 Tax=Strongylocentrotus purpuratus TaxID=7668 RepID=A0A7M7RIL3_STRPU|nr:pre-rRNA-processing protein TSR2 homolog [Strongylocentrotus purpuratus]|eukprot:XP_797024.2 PREDICTED: pre-rRNA-processing protein TSR2 homolog [Strongylocentrotus purpuratus]